MTDDMISKEDARAIIYSLETMKRNTLASTNLSLRTFDEWVQSVATALHQPGDLALLTPEHFDDEPPDGMEGLSPTWAW